MTPASPASPTSTPLSTGLSASTEVRAAAPRAAQAVTYVLPTFVPVPRITNRKRPPLLPRCGPPHHRANRRVPLALGGRHQAVPSAGGSPARECHADEGCASRLMR